MASPSLRRRIDGREADDPAGRLGLRGARQRVRTACPRRARRADGEVAAGPGSVGEAAPMPRSTSRLYAYCNAVMEPWDGPAALCGFDGRWAVAGLDRNGLRPLRYALTEDGLLVVGSETGMVMLAERPHQPQGPRRRRPDGRRRSREGRLLRSREIMDALAAQHRTTMAQEHRRSRRPLKKTRGEPRASSKDELRRRQAAAGFTLEDLELCCSRWWRTARKRSARWATTRRSPCCRDQYRGLAPFLPAEFQPGHQPADRPAARGAGDEPEHALQESRQHPGEDETQAVCCCSMPVLLTNELGHARLYGPERGARSTARSPPARPTHALRAALDASAGRRRRRCASAPPTHPDRRGAGPDRAADPDDPRDRRRACASGAPACAPSCSLNVRSAECLDAHYFAVLIGVGATTVNAYLARGSIADRTAAACSASFSLDECLDRYARRVEEGLLKIISQDGHLGDLVLSRRLQFRGHRPVARAGRRILPGHAIRISGIGLAGIQRSAPTPARARLERGRRSRCRSAASTATAGGETHAWQADSIHPLQAAVASDSYKTFKRYCEVIAKAAADRAARSAGLRAKRQERSRSTKSRASPKSASASSRPACGWARSRPRRTARSTSP